MQMKNKVKSEKGSMTVYVTVAVVTFTIILTAVFSLAVATRKNQIKTLIKIKEVYEQDNSKKEELHNKIKSQLYIKNGLALQYDAINNTGSGHDNITITWKDLSGNNNDGALTNMDINSVTSNWAENYISFNGQNNYILVPSSDSINSNAYTIEMVFNQEAVINEDKSVLIAKAGEYTIELNADNTISYGIGSNNEYYKTMQIINLNKIYYIAVTYENNLQKIYVNGELIGQSTVDGTVSQTQADLTIGANNTSYPFKGKIYATRIYNRSLTENEILQNFNIDKQKYVI